MQKKWTGQVQKRIAVMMCGLYMIFGAGICTAYAITGDQPNVVVTTQAAEEPTEAAEEPTETVIESTEAAEEPTQTVLESEFGTPFSIPGNGQLLDDIANEDSKEFFTVTTKNGNTFFLVIDRASSIDNVYLLSQIDEYDLMDFIDEERITEAETKEPVIIYQTVEPTDVVLREPEQTEMESNNNLMIGILLVAVVGVGVFVYFRFIRPEKDQQSDHNEGMETSED